MEHLCVSPPWVCYWISWISIFWKPLFAIDISGLFKKLSFVFGFGCCTVGIIVNSHQLRDKDFGSMWRKMGQVCCCCFRCFGYCSDGDVEEEEQTKHGTNDKAHSEVEHETFGDSSKQEKDEKCEASEYFLSMNRKEVLKWHLGGLLSLFRCGKGFVPTDSYQLIHHRNCYGVFSYEVVTILYNIADSEPNHRIFGGARCQPREQTTRCCRWYALYSIT